MNKTKTLLVLLALFLITLNLKGQDQTNKLELGFSINQFQKDFGLGIHLISPYFLHSKVAVRAGANLQWFEYFDGTETTWTPYQSIQLGLRSRSSIIENKIFIYGEGGVICLFPSNDFSGNSTDFGGYGLFGFEFKASQGFGYFIELGGVGTGARADQVVSKPIFSNGFMMAVGLRVGF